MLTGLVLHRFSSLKPWFATVRSLALVRIAYPPPFPSSGGLPKHPRQRDKSLPKSCATMTASFAVSRPCRGSRSVSASSSLAEWMDQADRGRTTWTTCWKPSRRGFSNDTGIDHLTWSVVHVGQHVLSPLALPLLFPRDCSNPFGQGLPPLALLFELARLVLGLAPAPVLLRVGA